MFICVSECCCVSVRSYRLKLKVWLHCTWSFTFYLFGHNGDLWSRGIRRIWCRLSMHCNRQEHPNNLGSQFWKYLSLVLICRHITLDGLLGCILRLDITISPYCCIGLTPSDKNIDHIDGFTKSLYHIIAFLMSWTLKSLDVYEQWCM